MKGEDGRTPRTLVIVDDDPEIRHALGLLFEFENFEVVGEAGNPLEGIAIAMRVQPGFVILDYLMPRLNGAETAKIVRTISPKSRIVAFSAVLTELPEWADAFLNKERIGQIAPLLEGLLETASFSAAAPEM